MSMDSGAMSKKLQRSFVNYSTGNILGLTSDAWSTVRAVNKDVEDSLIRLFTRLTPCAEDSGVKVQKRPIYPLDNAWKHPRLFVNDFSCADDYASLYRFFDFNRVSTYLSSQGHTVDNVDDIKLDIDYRLRQAMELMLQILSNGRDSRNVETEVDATKGSEPVDNSETYRSIYQAYNSPFEIRLITPERNKEFVSPNAPSMLLLFTSLVDEVQKVLVAISTNTQFDLSGVDRCCTYVDLLMGRRGCAIQYIRELLEDYNEWSYLKLDVTLSLSDAATLGDIFATVTSVRPGMFERLGRPVSDVGFSFAPCGCMIPYHLGVLSLLSEMNVINVTTPLSGGSAGSLTIVTSTSMRPNINDLMRITEGICADVRSNGSYHRLDGLVKDNVDHWMAPGTYMAVNNRIGELRVAMSARRTFFYHGQQISRFNDNVDLRDALRASCNIPGISAAGGVYFRGKRCYDGYFAARIYQHGCLDTAANRTVRINPFQMGRFEISLLRLDNKYVSPLLVSKDTYVVHYLRLKCLIKALWERKLTYESSGRDEEWLKEVYLMSDAYRSMTSGDDNSKCTSWSILLKNWGCGCSKQQPSMESGDLSGDSESLQADVDLSNLFMLVVASEMALKLGPSSKFSTRNWSGNIGGVNLIQTFGRLGRASIFTRYSNILSTPYCLIDWLEHELSMCEGVGSEAMNEDTILRELCILRQLRHLVLPPLWLTYYYTEFGYLLPNGLNTLRRVSVAINSAEQADIRYVFDVGRSDAFRWLVCEYISFENWLDLRIRQLEEMNDTSDPAYRSWNRDVKPGSSSESTQMIHERQHDYISGLYDFYDQGSVVDTLNDKNPASDTPLSASAQLQQMQNRLIRRAIVLNLVDPQYSHILSHTHLWRGS
ncbi:hypothetical protein BBOV_III009800 [Babesia bovis T2Bo]|uniref:PNPLA domain-containing protein n=1 Tax=Babesia bovis TaxID=5865 RepID=A7APQ2_BABBO|nr:hypothetical protein BBOV_III009800 [Babesia bovis T2Bo]EDO08536.1 hypothetical protein BBOV_III009800 [Babesia bovis T2Bo]|eukprot:XP_001612104.1 hypothetical protein [Babesia bovis T2Bo]